MSEKIDENKSTDSPLSDIPMAIGEHLNELRKLLIICLASIGIAAVVAYAAFGDQIMNFITSPMRKLGLKLIFTSPFEAFFTQMEASFFVGFMVVLPIVLWQVWSFILPALKIDELKVIGVLVPLSFILFMGGMAFAYFTVFQVAVEVLLITLPGPGLEPMIKINEYFSFLFSFILPFGITFEMPLIVYVLSKFGIINYKTLKTKRKYSIFIIFIASAVLTPGPDPLSQFLLAMPMMLLYEISIWVAYHARKKE